MGALEEGEEDGDRIPEGSLEARVAGQSKEGRAHYVAALLWLVERFARN